MKIIAVLFPADFPEEDKRLLFDALSRPDPPVVVTNKCYIFTPPEFDCFDGMNITEWEGTSPAIFVKGD